MRHLWVMASISALIAVCIAFGVLVGTGRISMEPRTTSQASPSAPAGEIDAAPFARRSSEAIRAGLEATGRTDVPENVITTLSTLEKIDDYPIYTMRYVGPYIRASELLPDDEADDSARVREKDWACSLFAAVGNPSEPMFGRNFDWEYSPLLVLFLEPEAGHRSIMTIDIAYLVDEADIDQLDKCGAEALLPLLDAPFLTFDGMNEHGLAMGMAAVGYECGYPSDPGKRDVGDMQLMREVLEAAATVDEAIEFLETINPISQGGPNMHYLIADRTPSAALIEYHDGEMVAFRSVPESPWQLGTNFPVVLADGSPTGGCWRYDLIEQTLRESSGDLSSLNSMDLLERVSTPSTQWSITYDISKRVMHLAIDRKFETVYRISLETGEVDRQQRTGSGH